MPNWFDSDPTSPVVFYQFEDGSSTPVPRQRATSLGFLPAVQPNHLPPPPVAPPPLPPVPVPPMPSRPTDAAPPLPVPAAVPEGSEFMFKGGAPTIPAPAPVVEVAPEPAPTAPTDVIPESGVTAAGVGYVPGPAAQGPADAAGMEAPPPAPTLLDAREAVDQGMASTTRSAIEQTGRDVEAELAAQAKQVEQEQRERQNHWNRYTKAIDQAANHKVDPNRYWKDMGTGRKIGTVLMAMISGLGSALKKQGDKNPALDMIMGFINQDVALQMEEKADLGRTAERHRTALDQLSGLTKDRESERAARISAIGMRESQRIREASAKAADEGVKLSYLQLADDLQAAAQQAGVDGWFREQEFLLKAAKTEAEVGKLNADAAKALSKIGSGGGGGASKSTIGTYANLDQIDKSLHDQAVRLPDGSWVIAPDADSAKKARESVGGSRVMVQNIDRALSKVTSIPGWSKKISGKLGFENSDIAVIKQELTQLLLNGKNYYTLGALSEGDVAIINRLGAEEGAATAFVQNVWPKLQNWRVGITNDAAAKLHSLGVDVDVEDAYGAAPEKPQDKTTEQLEAELTSSPELLTPEELEDGMDAIEESYKRDGLSSKETAKRLGVVRSGLGQGDARVSATIKDKTAELAKLMKKRERSTADKARIVKLRGEIDAAKQKRSEIRVTETGATAASRYQARGGTPEANAKAQKEEKRLQAEVDDLRAKERSLGAAINAIRDKRPEDEKGQKRWRASRKDLQAQYTAVRAQIAKKRDDLDRARGIKVD